jgi:PAS domain S-box-containing protein
MARSFDQSKYVMRTPFFQVNRDLCGIAVIPMYPDLILNASLLVALTTLYNLLARVRKDGNAWIKILSGLLFGGVAIAGMKMPFHYAPGIIYDGRSIVLAMAGLFGGSTVAVVSIVVAGAYRAFLGGHGMWAGLATIISCAMVGLAFRRACGNRPSKLGIPALYALGISVHITMLTCQLLIIPWPTGLNVIGRIWLPVLLIFPVATVLMGVLLRAEDRRLQAEAELHTISSRQEAILAAVPDIIMEVDNNKMYAWANQAGLEFFGEDVVGKEAAFYFEGEQETYDAVQPLFNGAENVIYVESWQRRKDGQKRLLAWWCRVIKDESGKVSGALSTARDITERKRAEEEIRKLNAGLELRVAERTAELEAKNRELESFSYSVSHDLRAPLRAISGFAEIIAHRYRAELDEQAQHYFDNIVTASTRMGCLIDDLLGYSRLGRQAVNRSVVKLDEVLAQAAPRRRFAGGDQHRSRPAECIWKRHLAPADLCQPAR